MVGGVEFTATPGADNIVRRMHARRPTTSSEEPGILNASWERRLAFYVDTVREMSLQTDPQQMVRLYSQRMRQVFRSDGFMSLSRRGLSHGEYRITRSSRWEQEVNPWRTPQRLPLFTGGLLGELIWGNEPRILEDVRVSADDPAREYLEGARTMVAIPLYDKGEGINMVVLLRHDHTPFERESFPEHVWMANLFGRATQNLVLSDELKRAYEMVDRELEVVADIQRSLLPQALPEIRGLDLAAHYETSRQAGGDYYDFFPLPDGRWGFFIADVSGHGTPAAVLMAVTHAVAHAIHVAPQPPSLLLNHVNRQLALRYTADGMHFVTAFYGVYNPADRTLSYSGAGHPPPRRLVKSSGKVHSVGHPANLPLGIIAEEQYHDGSVTLEAGDVLVLYTDGITEARAAGNGDLLDTERFDALIQPGGSAAEVLDRVLAGVAGFTGRQPAADDRTLLVARVQ